MTVWYLATSLIISEDYDHTGNIASTQVDDGSELVVQENGSISPGLKFGLQFGDSEAVPAGSPLSLIIKGWHEGSSSENVKLYQYVWWSDTWGEVTDVPNDFPVAGSERTYTFSINATSDCIRDGVTKFLINRASMGNAAHYFHIDYLCLSPHSSPSSSASASPAPGSASASPSTSKSASPSSSPSSSKSASPSSSPSASPSSSPSAGNSPSASPSTSKSASPSTSPSHSPSSSLSGSPGPCDVDISMASITKLRISIRPRI